MVAATLGWPEALCSGVLVIVVGLYVIKTAMSAVAWPFRMAAGGLKLLVWPLRAVLDFIKWVRGHG